eukprot:TRINITY_DN1912_c0_g2_i1.p1 TRINITY_DN1912_c0_g2~~TRINITY_DN1912_c0_g2_i1.p1  ORF type:complete len:315 (+),score=55.62 TRINITY_DN1912_c0_g2_i1:50-994(+)
MAAVPETWRSKLGKKYPKKEIETWDLQLKAELDALRKIGCNMRCFDYDAGDVTWASPKLGIFMCVACSDVHRAAGAHITCVKNFSTYFWGPDEVALMKAIGNARGRELYGEARVLPSDAKDHKVRTCTKKYGSSEVQKTIESQIAAITTDATSFYPLEAKSSHPALSISVSAPPARDNIRVAAQAKDQLETGWFDKMFGLVVEPPSASLSQLEAMPKLSDGTLSVLVASASPAVGSGVVAPKVKDDMDTDWLDELFGREESPSIAKCLDQSSTHKAFEKSTSLQCIHTDVLEPVVPTKYDSGLDDLIFKDFGNW